MCDKINKVIESISEGVQLTKVDLSGAGLTEFPDFLYPLYDCLEELNLGGNSIGSVPEAIVNFTKLRVLFFGQNEFDIYPVTLGQMPSLTMVSFKSNKIRTIPPTALGASITWLILTDNLIAGTICIYFFMSGVA
jgi:Leucine-rich repeat (LRR) protein